MKDLLEGGSKLLLFKIIGVGGIIIAALLLVFTSAFTVSMKSGHDAENSDSGNSGVVCNTTGQIDRNAWDVQFKNAGVFAGKQDVFLKIAEKQGIDPVLFAAISFHETSWGKSPAVVEKNNPGGLMIPGGGLMTFPTLDEGLEAMGKTLHNRIIQDGKTTIEALGSVYAPVGAENDPNNLNGYWVPTVTSIAKKLGGLTMNCSASDNENTSIEVGANGKMNYFDKVIKIMLQFKGQPYSWGGSNPSTGFDCSGLMQWSFGQIGIKLPRTASEQYNATKRISAKDAKAGDLVFFRGTYGGPSHVSHVGIYVGNGKMFNSNDSGIEYSDITTGYWAQHKPEFGRIQ